MAERMTRLEFYQGQNGGLVAAVEAPSVPRSGEFVSIRGKTYLVERVTWALDYADTPDRVLRANVELGG